jgi:predicted RNase H-like HicB family nuclease
MTLTAQFQRCEEGGYYATIVEIEGIHSQGETLAEAIENLADALAQTFAYKAEEALAQAKQELPDKIELATRLE